MLDGECQNSNTHSNAGSLHITLFCTTQDDYSAIIELAAAMNARFSNRHEIQKIAQNTLRKSHRCFLIDSRRKIGTSELTRIYRSIRGVVSQLASRTICRPLFTTISRILGEDECLGYKSRRDLVDG